MFSKIPKPMKWLTGLLIAVLLLVGIATGVNAALPDTVLQVEGTHIVVADSTDYNGDLGTRTDQIDLTSISATAAREGDKLDFGVDRAQLWEMYGSVVFAVAPTSGESVDYYIGFSPSCTAGTANPGGTSGSDSAYTGTEDDSLADSIKQLSYIGSLIATADATGSSADFNQFQSIGIFKTPLQCGNPVFHNQTGQSTSAGAVFDGILIVPLETQIQE